MLYVGVYILCICYAGYCLLCKMGWGALIATVVCDTQVSQVFTCTFRASCYSTRLSWAHTPGLSVYDSRLVVNINAIRG